jgi:Uma2 family endonuclease
MDTWWQRGGNGREVNFMGEMHTDDLQRPITVSEYHRMAEAGILDADERIELVDGQLIVVPPMGDRHWTLVTRFHRLLAASLGDRATVVAQMPVVLAGTSEPVPDISILRRDPHDYASGKPNVADIYCLIEIADSSLGIDRTKKLRLYQRARVPAYWIVNARDDTLESYREPIDTGYRTTLVYQRGDLLDVPGFPDVAFSVDELLG